MSNFGKGNGKDIGVELNRIKDGDGEMSQELQLTVTSPLIDTNNENGEATVSYGPPHEGMYSKGKRTNVVIMKEMKGYWKEMNDKGELLSICKKDDCNQNYGVCYFYSNGKINHISEYKNGEEMNVLKRFEGKKMIEFESGVKRYEGEYKDSIKDNYCREGKGKLYKNGGVIFDGLWIKGHRMDYVVFASLIVMLICTVIVSLLLYYLGIILFVIDVVFWLVFWIHTRSLGFSFISFDYKQLNLWFLLIVLGVIFNVLYLLISSPFLINRQINISRCRGSIYGSSLEVVSNSCNSDEYSSFIPRSHYESIEIGDSCFENVDTFRIDGINNLKSIKIGINSFTKKNSWVDNPSRSFHILNCEKLEWIEIGEYSFFDYSGEFELKNLPSLSSIKIGIIGHNSWNFDYSSFVVKDLPNLQSIELGDNAFYDSILTVISNLPNLKSIQLGLWTLNGINNDSCSLEMKDLPKLEEISSNGLSFRVPRSVILSNIPNLKTVKLSDSFQRVKTKSISSDVSSLLADLVKIQD